MKNQITLGKGITIDLSRLIETRLLVQASAGFGKSWLLRKILEESHGKIQQIVLDLEGEFFTLREKFDDYILVGKEKDIDIDIRGAELLARKLMELNANAIIDLSEMKKHERTLFVKRFLDSLLNLPRSAWHPVMVVIDEAHVFCPEGGKSESMMSVIDLCTRGRKRGLLALLATQRISKLNKDAAAELRNKLIGSTGLDIDMKRAADELGLRTKEEIMQLRDLNPGEFFAFGTAMEFKGIKKVMIGAVQTTHLKIGVRDLGKTPPPQDKVLKILQKLEDLPKEAEEELRTIQDHKRKINDLQREVRTLKLNKPAEKTIMVADSKAIRELEGKVKEKEKMFGIYWDKLQKSHKNDREMFKNTIKGIQDALVRVLEKTKIEFKDTEMPEMPKINLPETPKINVPGKQLPLEQCKGFMGYKLLFEENSNQKLGSGASRMLGAVARFHPNPISRNQMATLATISPNSGTFGTYFSALKSQGLIEDNNGEITLTQEGLEKTMHIQPIPVSPDAILSAWIGVMKGGASRMLQVVFEVYPGSISKEELGEKTGLSPNSGTFNTYLSKLRSNNLVVVKGSEITASKELFGEG